ncbi:MAG TPA: S16 family serine protease [Acidimicrobiales bacterium]
MVAGLLVSFVVGSAFLPVPYVAMRPGTARPVTQYVTVRGATSYPPEESIAYMTVNIGQISLLEAAVGWLDDDVDIRPEEVIRGGRSVEENRRYNAQLMDASKQVASTVALRHLGYEVTIRTSGTIVRQIVEDAPAADVLELDDVVVAVDGEPVDEPDEMGEALQVGGPGATHVLTVERPAGSTNRIELEIETVPAPDDSGRAVIGVVPEERIVEFDLPIEVLIDSGEVGGPSAGLAFTLALLDVLTEGELTGGHRVAATGTIALDGTVGPVGGPAQKAVTVRDAGYEVFLVPSAEVEDVSAAVGDDLEVIGVDTLAEALDALGSLGGNAGSIRAQTVGGSP